MSDDSQVICPECETRQSASLPFCENCGYRIRSRKTASGGLPVVTGDRVAQARQKASRARADRISTGENGVVSQAAESLTGASSEGEDAFGAEQPRSLRADAVTEPNTIATSNAGDADDTPRTELSKRTRPKKQPNTYIEGLTAVDSSQLSSASASANAAPRAPDSRADTDESGSTQRVSSFSGAGVQQRARLPIYVAIWLSLTAVAVLTTYFWTARAHSTDAAAIAADLPARVSVASGPYLRGLDEGVRSFIMQMCERTDNAPDENCGHDTLFEGEYPQRSVEMAAFEIDAGEVTVGAFKDCVDAGKCSKIDYKGCDVWTPLGLQVALRVPRDLQQPAGAQTCVNLSQARDYCAFAGGALPTPDQWEKAARGEDARLFPWGNAWSVARANWAEQDLMRTPVSGQLDGFERIAPPGSFPEGKSPSGAYDMAGNAAEWVAGANDSRPGARGGAWTSSPFNLRVTHRLKLAPSATRTDVGFRCAYSQ